MNFEKVEQLIKMVKDNGVKNLIIKIMKMKSL